MSWYKCCRHMLIKCLAFLQEAVCRKGHPRQLVRVSLRTLLHVYLFLGHHSLQAVWYRSCLHGWVEYHRQVFSSHSSQLYLDDSLHKGLIELVCVSHAFNDGLPRSYASQANWDHLVVGSICMGTMPFTLTEVEACMCSERTHLATASSSRQAVLTKKESIFAGRDL